MASAGYLVYDPASRRFTLPAEHALALAQEGGPVFFGGVYQMMTAFGGILDRLTEAFRAGGDVPQSAYDDNMWEGGVADRVRFEQRDVSKGFPAQYDVITTFDVVHDAVDPVGLLRTIRQCLCAGGVYVCLDANCSDKLQEN